ncbi:Zn-ribbon domain-containing OB-fold protein [Streptomyces daliensis]
MPPIRTPVADGWFSEEGGDFTLLGTRCLTCTSVFFPREDTFCRNPSCAGTRLEEVPLSRRGRVWSYTDGRYQPPPPYVWDADREWEPYALVAVELEAERMVVLGQAPPGVTVDDLAVGMEVEVVPGVLNEDAEHIWTTWHWKPVPVEGAR